MVFFYQKIVFQEEFSKTNELRASFGTWGGGDRFLGRANMKIVRLRRDKSHLKIETIFGYDS
jgi:hypothetical protein